MLFVMDIYVGTSGWMYSWNPDGFDWYIRHSGLNSVELNSSFYRFPYPNQVKSWARKTPRNRRFNWSIKIHRSISHYKLLKHDSINIWNKFEELFEPLNSYIDFYLLQLPPRFKMNNENIDRIRSFINHASLAERLAIEFRNETWFNEEAVSLSRELGFTYVSIDSPEKSFIASTHGIVYLRMHGRSGWYTHYYTDEELMEIKEEIFKLKPIKIYIYFNNNHDMLENARRMMNFLKDSK